jgi:hypothetical protein
MIVKVALWIMVGIIVYRLANFQLKTNKDVDLDHVVDQTGQVDLPSTSSSLLQATTALPPTSQSPPTSTEHHHQDHPSVMMCFVGGLRSFDIPAVHNSIYKNVYEALGGPTHVDVYSITVRADNPTDTGPKMQAKRCHGEIELNVKDFFPTNQYYIQMAISNCQEYDQVVAQEDNVTTTTTTNSTTVSSCPENGSGQWLQMAWLKRCFAKAHKEYDWYVRVRPDMYFDNPVPNLTSLNPAVIYSSVKRDSLASDQFFIMSHELYQSWWQDQVAKVQFFGCCPEAHIFTRKLTMKQLEHFDTCLARDLTKCDSWEHENQRSLVTEKYLAVVSQEEQSIQGKKNLSNISCTRR